MPEDPQGRPPHEAPAVRAWRTYRSLRHRGVLTVRRVGCAVVLLVLLAVAPLVVLDRAVAGFAALFREDPVAGGPFDAVAPSAPARSGSEVVDRIVARDRLIVAVHPAPGSAERDPATGEYTGFDVALLELLARDLDVDPERTSYKPLPPGIRDAALERGEVDLVLGATQGQAGPAFAGPYRVSPLRLAVPPGSPVTSLDELGADQVCAVEGSAAEGLLAGRLGPRLVTRGSLDACTGILGPRVVAVAADEAALAERADLVPVGPALGEARYGIALPAGDDAFRDRAQGVLGAAVRDGTWARLYAEHLGTPVPEPPLAP